MNVEDLNAVLQHSVDDFDRDLLDQLQQLRNISMPDFERMEIECFADVRSITRSITAATTSCKTCAVGVCSAMFNCHTRSSFSQLRRIKNYLRSTMNQDRLNYAMVAEIHGDILDQITL